MKHKAKFISVFDHCLERRQQQLVVTTASCTSDVQRAAAIIAIAFHAEIRVVLKLIHQEVDRLEKEGKL